MPRRPTASSTFLAPGQDINGTVLHAPRCPSGCVLSGDSTAILARMTWNTWSAADAVGTGSYEIDGCNPGCKALQGENVPQNPWVFSSLITAARQSCAS